MATHAPSAAATAPHGATGCPACDPLCQPESAGICGSATITATKPSDDGPLPLGALRLALLTEARRLKNLRKSKVASICEAKLRRVTHEILGRGKSDA